MNRIDNLLVFLLLISFILPATAIKHASGSTDNDTTSNSQKSNLVGSERCTSIENCSKIPPVEPPAVVPEPTPTRG